jgi:hypothetical protein
MKLWYKAVCDDHKEMCDCMVDGPKRSFHYLINKHDDIVAWFQLHRMCPLRLIRDDEELDYCFERGYLSVTLKDDDPVEHEKWLDEYCRNA